LLDSLLQEMSSDETYDEKTGQISSLLSIRDLPAWAAIMIAFGVAAVGSCVLLMIICIVCKAKQRKSQRVSEAHRALTATSQALTMKNLGGKSNSQMIIISEADSTVRNSEEDDDLDDDGPVDFLSVRDLNVTRYNSAKDLQSLSTYKSVRSVTAENISMCSKISDRSWIFKQESFNPTPTAKLDFQEYTNDRKFCAKSKESLTTLSTFKTASSETLKAGTEFWVRKEIEVINFIFSKIWNKLSLAISDKCNIAIILGFVDISKLFVMVNQHYSFRSI